MRATASALVLSVLLPALASPVAAQRERPGWIGISLDVPTADARGVREAEVLIAAVRRGSPAEAAGLRAGDRLISVDDLRGIDDFRNLPERLRLRAGDPVEVRVERDGRRIGVVLRAAERPDDVRARTILVELEPDSIVETMVRAMDSLRVQIIQARGDRDRERATAPSRVRLVQGSQATGVAPPFEFFVFRGEEHDSLRQAMDDLNRMSRELREQEASIAIELQRASRRDVDDADRQLQAVRAALEEVTRESARLRTAMSEAARATAGFDYTFLPDPSPSNPTPPTPFRPLTPYLLGSNMVAGAQVVDLRPELAQYFDVEGGVLIVDVAPGTPAAMAGMVPGDVITRLDQVTIRSVEELRFGISRSGASLPVRLVRRGSTLEVLLTRR